MATPLPFELCDLVLHLRTFRMHARQYLQYPNRRKFSTVYQLKTSTTAQPRRREKVSSNSPERLVSEEQHSTMIQRKPVNQSSSIGSREPWQIQKEALKQKFGEAGWKPRKRLSPIDMETVRRLHAQDSTLYSTPMLAEQFKISPEAIRRILRSRWRPNEEEQREQTERWNRRGERIWNQMVELGVRPAKRWKPPASNDVDSDRLVEYNDLPMVDERGRSLPISAWRNEVPRPDITEEHDEPSIVVDEMDQHEEGELHSSRKILQSPGRRLADRIL